jgi:hypothetical protein
MTCLPTYFKNCQKFMLGKMNVTQGVVTSGAGTDGAAAKAPEEKATQALPGVDASTVDNRSPYTGSTPNDVGLITIDVLSERGDVITITLSPTAGDESDLLGAVLNLVSSVLKGVLGSNSDGSDPSTNPITISGFEAEVSALLEKIYATVGTDSDLVSIS